MIKKLSAAIDIAGPADEVWAALTNFAGYHHWNPFIIEAEGTAAVGSRLWLRMQPVGSRPSTLRPHVRDVVEGRRIQWVGTLVAPSVLAAEHTFTIEPRWEGCRLVQEETFSGAAVPLIKRSLDRRVQPAFAAMNSALKALVEG